LRDKNNKKLKNKKIENNSTDWLYVTDVCFIIKCSKTITLQINNKKIKLVNIILRINSFLLSSSFCDFGSIKILYKK
jgi:hypothetical protein